jgi:hypothetical protein
VRWPENAEMALSTEPRFTAVWEAFCELNPPQPMATSPGFCCLRRVLWPQPEVSDRSPCAVLLRVAHALNAERDKVPQRLALKALNPVLFQDWMASRARAQSGLKISEAD